MAQVGFGYREVCLDQQISGKWIDIALSLGSHSTFQVRKFSDSAGGFSYKSNQSKQLMQNRAIYWRTLNDTLEMIEISLDYNLYDNQVRYIFRDSPIVGQVTIKETDTSIIILVATVATVNRIILAHPKHGDDTKFSKNNTQPSIFHQVLGMGNKSIANMESFNIYDQLINIPIPLTAHSEVLSNGECVFALSFLSGSVNICKISNVNTLHQFDLRQSNIFSRLWSGFKPIFNKSQTVESHSVIALDFFTAKYEKNRNCLFLVTLSMNGHFSLWKCHDSSAQTLNDWTMLHDQIVHNKFISQIHTDSSMLLRKAVVEKSGEHPSYSIFIPGEGFKIYKIAQNSRPSAENPSLYLIVEGHFIEFKEKEIVDYALTSSYLYHLSRNSDEDTEWDIKSYKIDDGQDSRFNLALLEPLPYTEVEIIPDTLDPKDFYFDLIFNKSSFSAQTIYKSLGMFQSAQNLNYIETDWEQLKLFAMNIIDSEIAYNCSSSDTLLTDVEYFDVNLKYWHGFYTSCVEYHMNTIKPLGIFYDLNLKLLCIVKKSRISFLRQTDFLETLFYFPRCVQISDIAESLDENSLQLSILLRYLEIIETIEGTLDEAHKNKIEKRLRENSSGLEDVCEEISNYFVAVDPLADDPVNRHFITDLSSKIDDLGPNGIVAMKLVLSLLSSWNHENIEILHGGTNDEMLERDLHCSAFFMGSRIGANLSFKSLKQLVQHRFMISRNTIILQSILGNIISHHQNNTIGSEHQERIIQMDITIRERRDAVLATLQYFGLIKALERNGELVNDFLIERGLKVANVLNCNTSDHIIPGNLKEFWPVKLIELFLMSNVGGLSVRSKVSRSNNLSGLLNYSDAAGRTLWPNEATIDHPYEEFLISTCQYSALLSHAYDMRLYFKNTEANLRELYQAIVELCTGNPETALRHFRSISLADPLWPEPYFYNKILKAKENVNTSLLYYQKVVSLMQIFDFVSGIQIISDDALMICTEDESRSILCALAFKSALHLRDYHEAFNYILRMPSETSDGDERGEKISSLRTFIGQIISCGDVETLISLKLDDMFSPYCTMREQVEEILEGQAALCNPLSSLGVYQMLYLYHLKQQNYHKAALSMFSRAVRLGEKSNGVEALKAQHNTYLDILNCLALVENPKFRVVWLTSLSFFQNEEEYQPTVCFDGSIIPKIMMSKKVNYFSYADILKQYHVLSGILLLNGKVSFESIKMDAFKYKAEGVYLALLKEHYYDDALKLSKLWGLSQDRIIESFTSSCINLALGIMPYSGDPLDYIKHIDFSEVPNKDSNVIEKAFYLLQKYLNETESLRSTRHHKLITIKLLEASIPLPQWLIDSYKKRDCNELIRCYYRYGIWDEAIEIITKIFEVTLGRRAEDEFDNSIRLLSSLEAEPYLPFDLIDDVVYEIKKDSREDPSLTAKLVTPITKLVQEYETRFRDTRKERAAMYNY